MLWLRLALKEIRNNFRFSLFFVINLAIGLIGFIALDSFRGSIERHLGDNSKAILGADVQISSRFPLGEVETGMAEDLFGDEPFIVSDQISFLSMVAANDNSRMSQLIGIDANYPHYGEIVLRDAGPVSESDAREALLAGNHVWVARDLAVILELETGDSVKIGEQSFTVTDVILEDPSSTISVMSNFPAIYMGLEQLNETGLIQLGSRVSYSRFYKLPPDFDVSGLEEAFNAREREVFRDSRRVSLTTHVEESEDLGRILGYMSDYLGLIALIALFLAGVGAAYLFRSFLTTRFHDMAILLCLGGTPRQARRLVLLQILLLGGAAALLASLAAWLALPLLPQLFENFLPRGFSNAMSLESLLLALFLGTLGSLFCCLPVLTKIRELNPVALFQENLQPSPPRNRRQVLLSYLPLLGVFWALAVWQGGSLLIGTLFILGFLAATVLLGAIGWLILRACGRLSNQPKVTRKLALRNLSRNRLGALSCYLAIGLGALLINLIPQIQRGLEEEITRPGDFSVPDFFLFDIQPDQLAPLEATLAGQGYDLSFLSPMISARLEAVNDVVIDEVDETPDEQLLRRRSYNLTYQAALKESETLVEGEPFDGSWEFGADDLPGISLEVEFAERMGFELGDVLTFDVQSVPVSGRVVNTRRVDWNSFQPNFFIAFQPGVLDPAPKTFVAAISEVAEADRIPVQNSIVRELPNVSIINVTQIVARILDITDQISWAIRVMAYLAIFAGLVVLFSIARYEVKSRYWEINLLKVLGARFSDVRGIVQLEFGILGLFAALTGVTLSLLMSWGISWFVFDNLWAFSWFTTLFSVLAITALSVLTALLATLSVLRQKPLALLRAV